MRGKLRASTGRTGSSRITPAGAGKTIIPKHIHGQKTDHPRRCGENFEPFPPRLIESGSPPQVRGKLKIYLSMGAKTRITPAGAGKTSLQKPFGVLITDHPRRCGENTPHHKEQGLSPGSPPQVRGKLIVPKQYLTAPRITPAGAGKTFSG